MWSFPKQRKGVFFKKEAFRSIGFPLCPNLELSDVMLRFHLAEFIFYPKKSFLKTLENSLLTTSSCSSRQFTYFCARKFTLLNQPYGSFSQ
jgi:hypothetical protein